MERVRKLRQQALKYFDTADHLAYVTYPLINDVKLLTTIAENLYYSLRSAMEALLYYDRLYKRIPPIVDNFETKIEVFKKCMNRYNLDREALLLIRDLRAILKFREKSPMEFQRKDKYVICSPTYNMRSLTLTKIKNYISTAKPFIHQINRILEKNDRIR